MAVGLLYNCFCKLDYICFVYVMFSVVFKTFLSEKVELVNV